LNSNRKTPTLRLIPRLDIKGSNVVKGINLEGLRVVGAPGELASRYYRDGADELLYMDIVASLYGRNSLLDIVEKAAGSIFIPMTVGGGVRTMDDIRAILRAGADKVAINTAAVKTPSFISDAARRFGSQCIVVSIEAKRREPGRWEALTDNGREKTGLDAVAWAHKAAELGAGEILVTSVDQEGTGGGYDLELTSLLAKSLAIPVIACGGAGSPAHVADAANLGGADAVALASLLHYNRKTIGEVKDELARQGLPVRRAPAVTHG
jgi:cyclase